LHRRLNSPHGVVRCSHFRHDRRESGINLARDAPQRNQLSAVARSGRELLRPILGVAADKQGVSFQLADAEVGSLAGVVEDVDRRGAHGRVEPELMHAFGLLVLHGELVAEKKHEEHLDVCDLLAILVDRDKFPLALQPAHCHRGCRGVLLAGWGCAGRVWRAGKHAQPEQAKHAINTTTAAFLSRLNSNAFITPCASMGTAPVVAVPQSGFDGCRYQ